MLRGILPRSAQLVLMRWALVATAFAALTHAVSAQTVVTLVGTGGPELTPDRAGVATLVQSGDEALLFDAGRGVLDGLYQSRIEPARVTRVFLTHLHSDHIEGLPGLWITPWFLLGRSAPLEVWGPVGTSAMIDGMRSMYAHDLAARPNASLARSSLDIRVHEIAAGVVFEHDGVRVTAIPVEHADGDPAFAYRVDTPGGAILLTGDCTLSAELERVTGPLDLVVANVAAASASLKGQARLKPILAKLLSPEQAAQLFAHATPRLAVYSHLVKKGLSGREGDREIVRRTRAAGYRGPLLMGTDHTRIVLSRPIRVEHLTPPQKDFDGPDSRF
jgi:ribonuclease Z